MKRIQCYFDGTSDETIEKIYQLDHRSRQSYGTMDGWNKKIRIFSRTFFCGTNQCELSYLILLSVNLRNLMNGSPHIQW